MENEEIIGDMQSLPAVAKNVIKYTYEKVQPTTTLPRALGAEDSPIEFILEGRNESLIDVKNIIQVAKVKIKKIANNAKVELAAADVVVPYCGFMYTMWKDIQVDINHKATYTTHGFYDLISYIKTLYCMPNEAKNSKMLNSLWYRDSASGMSVISNNIGTNKGQFWRIARASRSKTIEMSGKLMIECLDVARPFPENVSINLKFYPNEAKKCVLSDDALHTMVEIEDLYLIVPRIIPKTSLLGVPVRLPFVKTEVHRFMFNSGSVNFGPRSIIHTDSLPRRCIVAILTEEQLNGNREKCRREFKHHDVDQVLLTVNGEHCPYRGGYQQDFDSGEYSLLYESLFTELGDESTIDISREDFSGGFVIYAFDISQKNVGANYYTPKKSGQADIQIHFKTAPDENLAILVLLEEERIGKSHFVAELLESRNKMFNKPFDKVIWCYGIEQPSFFSNLKEKIADITFLEGFPESQLEAGTLFAAGIRGCLIIDDLGDELIRNKTLVKLFTRISHHRDISVILILQCMYYPGDSIRACQRNSTHLLIFKNHRDALSIRHMAKQIFVNDSNFMITAYEQATNNPRNCLLVDLTPGISSAQMLRSNILSDDNYIVYKNPASEDKDSK